MARNRVSGELIFENKLKLLKHLLKFFNQGNDPSTDFRGMGLLGLTNLSYFVTSMNDLAKSIFSKSLHPKYGYPFAIVGINITSWIHKLLLDGHLKTHFYNDSELLAVDKIKIENFNKIYCRWICFLIGNVFVLFYLFK